MSFKQPKQNDIMLAAIATRDPSSIRAAAEQGANPSRDDHSLLIYAACSGTRDLIAPVFRAAPDKKAAANSAAIKVAILRGHDAVVDYIVSSGLLTQRTLDEALQLAVANSRIEFANLLLTAGANPHYEQEPETSALWFALAAEDEELLKIFHQHGHLTKKQLPRLHHYGFRRSARLIEMLLFPNALSCPLQSAACAALS